MPGRSGRLPAVDAATGRSGWPGRGTALVRALYLAGVGLVLAQAGANVVMPNLSPVRHRKDYALYDGKICTGEEAAECLFCLSRRIESAGFQPDFSRGDHPDAERREAQICP